jgi:hypothetical protein
MQCGNRVVQRGISCNLQVYLMFFWNVDSWGTRFPLFSMYSILIVLTPDGFQLLLLLLSRFSSLEKGQAGGSAL